MEIVTNPPAQEVHSRRRQYVLLGLGLLLIAVGLAMFRHWPAVTTSTDISLYVLLGVLGIMLAPVIALLARVPVVLAVAALLLAYGAVEFPQLGLGIGSGFVVFAGVWLLEDALEARPRSQRPANRRIHPVYGAIVVLALAGAAAALYFHVLPGLLAAGSLLVAAGGFWLWKKFEPPPRTGFVCVYSLRGWFRALLSYGGQLVFVLGGLGFFIALALLR